jgi:hypothetical protein
LGIGTFIGRCIGWFSIPSIDSTNKRMAIALAMGFSCANGCLVVFNFAVV